MQGLGHGPPEHQAEGHGQGAQQEGDPPAIAVQGGGRHDGRQPQANERAHGGGDVLARPLPGDNKAAAAGRRDLEQVSGVGAHLAAQREALDQAGGHRQHRGQEADRAVGRDQGQAGDRDAHQHIADHHRRAPADLVGIGPQHQPADRPGQEPGAEGGQRQHQAAEGVAGGEEGVADLDGEEGVGDEVVELERIAHHRREHMPLGEAGQDGRVGHAAGPSSG